MLEYCKYDETCLNIISEPENKGVTQIPDIVYKYFLTFRSGYPALHILKEIVLTSPFMYGFKPYSLTYKPYSV